MKDDGGLRRSHRSQLCLCDLAHVNRCSDLERYAFGTSQVPYLHRCHRAVFFVERHVDCFCRVTRTSVAVAVSRGSRARARETPGGAAIVYRHVCPRHDPRARHVCGQRALRRRGPLNARRSRTARRHPADHLAAGTKHHVSPSCALAVPSENGAELLWPNRYIVFKGVFSATIRLRLGPSTGPATAGWSPWCRRPCPRC